MNQRGETEAEETEEDWLEGGGDCGRVDDGLRQGVLAVLHDDPRTGGPGGGELTSVTARLAPGWSLQVRGQVWGVAEPSSLMS